MSHACRNHVSTWSTCSVVDVPVDDVFLPDGAVAFGSTTGRNCRSGAPSRWYRGALQEATVR